MRESRLSGSVRAKAEWLSYSTDVKTGGYLYSRINPIQLEMLDLRAFHQEIMWKGRLYFIQNGWVFDRRTHKAVIV